MTTHITAGDKNVDTVHSVRARLRVVLGSYTLLPTGILIVYLGYKFGLPSVAQNVVTSIGVAVIQISLLDLFFAHFGQRSLMTEFSERVKSIFGEHSAGQQIRDSGIIGCLADENYTKQIESIINNSETIRICKMWIPESEFDLIKHSLDVALKSRRSTVVQILCMDPDSKLLTQRCRDLGNNVEAKAERAHASLLDLFEFINENGFADRVTIKVFENLPSVSLYAGEHEALVGWYWYRHLSFKGPVLKVVGPLHKRAMDNFEWLWGKATAFVPRIEEHCIHEASRWFRSPVIDLAKMRSGRNADSSPTLSTEPIEMDSASLAAMRDLAPFAMQHLNNRGYIVLRNIPFDKDVGLEFKKKFLSQFANICGEAVTHLDGKSLLVWEIAYRDIQREIQTYSEGKDEAPLHTDSAYKQKPEGYVMLFMEQPAEHGGRNILLRVGDILSKVKVDERRFVTTLKALEFPCAIPSVYHESPKCWNDKILTDKGSIRFREDTIRKGLELTPDYRTSDRLEALAWLTKTLYSSPARRGIILGQGDLLIINNHTVLHSRTAFEDKQRLLLRVRFNGRGK